MMPICFIYTCKLTSILPICRYYYHVTHDSLKPKGISAKLWILLSIGVIFIFSRHVSVESHEFPAIQALAVALSPLCPYTLLPELPNSLIPWRDQILLGYFIFTAILLKTLATSLSYAPSMPHLLFLAYFWLSRPTSSLFVTTLIHKMKFTTFIVSQPILLYFLWPGEQQACVSAAKQSPAFGNAVDFFRTLLHSANRKTTPSNDVAALDCCKIHFFLIALEFVLLSVLLWCRDQRILYDFVWTDPKKLAFSGGPSCHEINTMLYKFRKARHRDPRYCSFYYIHDKWRVAAIYFVAVAVLWQLIDATLPAFLFAV